MLTDHWVIAQLVAQGCAVFLLLGAMRNSWVLVRSWDVQATGSFQLGLERKTYLVSSIVGFAMVFQLLSLLMFLVTVNEHLPNLIKGAMCATGTLGLNPWGYPLLFLKMGAVFVYLGYLVLHYLDEQEPSFPLTPLKYWWVFPSALLATADLFLMFRYFSAISPDIIATCCSVAFTLGGTAQQQTWDWAGDASLWLPGFWIAAFGLCFAFLFLRKKPFWAMLMSLLFVTMAVLSLKTFFVKYIYGLPSHLCLFDLFLPNNGFIGYAIFGGYYLLLGSVSALLLFKIASSRLTASFRNLEQKLWISAQLGAAVAFSVPVAYWLAWPGQL